MKQANQARFRTPTDAQLDAMAKRASSTKNPTTAREEATKFWPDEDAGVVEGKRDIKADKRLANRLKMCFVRAGKAYPWNNRRGRPIS